jgi:hypothetical protein
MLLFQVLHLHTFMIIHQEHSTCQKCNAINVEIQMEIQA